MDSKDLHVLSQSNLTVLLHAYWHFPIASSSFVKVDGQIEYIPPSNNTTKNATIAIRWCDS